MDYILVDIVWEFKNVGWESVLFLKPVQSCAITWHNEKQNIIRHRACFAKFKKYADK